MFTKIGDVGNRGEHDHQASSTTMDCIFCKIIKGAIPSFKVFETKLSYAFLDLGPLSKGHTVCTASPRNSRSPYNAIEMHIISS